MERFLDQGGVQFLLGLLARLAVLAAFAAACVWVIRKIRAESLQREPAASEMLSKFREAHTRGELSDAEFREIKTSLVERLHDELKGDGHTG
ncbi:MAG: hypothetical protein JW809_00010 [Pirellulales bacterium]|nr:hypothetical protein [Pirellulales bacterium]